MPDIVRQGGHYPTVSDRVRQTESDRMPSIIDQHGPEGKALQERVKIKLRDFLGEDYNDEARAPPPHTHGSVRQMLLLHILIVSCVWQS